MYRVEYVCSCRSSSSCLTNQWPWFRSSHQRCTIKKGAIKNFAKFIAKNLCQSLSLKSCRLQPATLLKNKFWHSCFPMNFVKLLRAPFLQNTSRRLLLLIPQSQLVYIALGCFGPYVKFCIVSSAIFTRKHLCWSLFLIKLLRRDSKTGVLPVTIGKFLRTLFLPHISVSCFCTPNGWIFYVFTLYLVDLIAVLRNKRQCADFNKFVKVKSNPLVYFLWEIREDSVSKAQRKVNMIKTKDKFFGFL